MAKERIAKKPIHHKPIPQICKMAIYSNNHVPYLYLHVNIRFSMTSRTHDSAIRMVT